jgi:hypothetical protein
MDMGARRWLVKTAYKNLWRVHSFYDLDDLIQDGHMMYALVVQRYPQAKDPPHIMRLFQITFLNHIHDLSKHQSRMAALIDATVDLDAGIASVRRFFLRYADRALLNFRKGHADPLKVLVNQSPLNWSDVDHGVIASGGRRERAG